MTIINDRTFLSDILESCHDRNIGVWIFGGWAEELLGLSGPRTHNDVDLLYPAPDFTVLDGAIHEACDWREIVSKRFPHKRAITVQGIMVEFFLVQRDGDNAFTDFFGRFRLDWPKDTFGYLTSLSGSPVSIASEAALAKYRRESDFVRAAYHEYIAEHDNALTEPHKGSLPKC